MFVAGLARDHGIIFPRLFAAYFFLHFAFMLFCHL